MMLRQRKGCYDPKDLEGVLPVLDRCLYEGGDGGVVLYSDLRAEASADLELGLCRTKGLLTVVVRRRDGRICQKRNGSTKFNKLCINVLKAIYGLSDELDTLLFGGSSRKFLKAPLRLQNGSNRLIFNELKAKYSMQ